MTTSFLDATTLPLRVRHPRILETFDALSIGDALVLASDHYPLPLLHQLQAERPDQADWSVLEAGETFRVEIRRRDASAPRGVAEYLAWDHDRLDALLEAAGESVASSSFDEARARFAELACGLGRHIDIEERVVFPVFERGEAPSGPTAVMRFEHERIRPAIHAIETALERSNAPAFHDCVESLLALLGEHNTKEEAVLYPAIDRMLTAAERAALVVRAQALPA